MAACMRRSLEEGNNFAPDLTDFLALVHSTSSTELGIPFEEVAKEFKRYCRERGYYDSAELFPWTNSNWLLYWICTSVRQRMVRYNLSEADVDKALRNEVRDWAAKLAAGEQVPTPATRIENKTRPRPAWMDLLEQKELAEMRKQLGPYS
ncbi:replication protein P [Rahnella bonaserana]|uniref:replication protein P n=1 Tax=Rahnella bonaserana TaxID=2816248 RepID=UPI0024C39262|nr:replication protein P [Rahnella bonaserana]WHZ42179.1 replication protein P [Rahnella bonaserana]